jgi:tryptophanyl-tRNA synthetase
MSIKTDSTPVEESKDPEACSVFALHSLFCDGARRDELASRYRAGGMGYGEAKQQLFDVSMEFFAEARERRAKLESDPDQIRDVLESGARAARKKGREVLDRVQSACGLRQPQS